MNYRGGFLRLYAVLTMVWVAWVVYSVPSGRWQPYRIDYDAITSRYGGKVLNSGGEIVTIDAFLFEPAVMRLRWTWAIGLSTGPPAAGYLVFFVVGPWIYRGFRQTAQ